MGKSLLNAFLTAFMISGLLLAGDVYFGEAQISATAPSMAPTDTPTPTPPFTASSTPSGPTSTPTSSPPSQFPTPRTNVGGIIISDTTWTKTDSPYNFTEPVIVNPGVALTIEPGVLMNLNDNYLQVNGTLVARGSGTDPIRFNPGEENPPGMYFKNGVDGLPGYDRGIFFLQSSTSWNEQTQSGSIIENAILRCDVIINNTSPKLSLSSVWGIDIYGGSPIISNDNIMGGIGLRGSSAVISDNTITEQIHYFFGVYAQDYDRNGNAIVIGGPASPVISNNIFNGSTDIGIGFFDSSGSGFPNENCNIEIINNTMFNLRTGVDIFRGSGTITVTGNTIYNCRYAVATSGPTVVIIQRNLIGNNSYGIFLEAPAIIQNNSITNNSVGISTSSPATIFYNNLQGNQQSISLSSSNNLNATYNWWGTTDIAAINQSIYDFNDNFTLGIVTFVPLLDAPNPQAASLTPIPTPSPTQMPSQTPTPTPAQSSSQSPTTTPTQTLNVLPTQSPTPWISGTGVYAILIGVLIVLIVAFAIVLITLIRRKRR